MSILGGMQRTAVTALAGELRSGGLLTVGFAFGLGALHALTPGHGKSALAVYFLGQESRAATGIRITLAAAFLHVAMGFAAFVVLRFVLGHMPLMVARGSPFFSVTGYGLIIFAGVVMLIHSLWPVRASVHAGVLAIGVGLLPCPLTISVLGFAWAQSSGLMVALVLVSLAAGIAFTIGTVALLAIAARRSLGHVLVQRLDGFQRGAMVLQGIAGAAIVAIAGYSLWKAL
jgi:nickel/cobalt transporter (NicO) family protein